MTLFLQTLFTGLGTGAVYSLVAVGFALLFATGRYPNFAQGDWASFAGFAGAAVVTAGLPLAVAAVAAPLVGAVTGVATFLVVRLARSADVLTIALTLLALGLVLQGVELWLWGTNPRAIPGFATLSPIRVHGAILTRLGLIVIVVAVALVAVLLSFLRFTYVGRVLGAWTENPEAAALSGINVNAVLLLAFLIAGAFAGIAGFFYTAQNGVDYTVGLPMTLKAFGAAAIGGLTSPALAVAGGFALGLIESGFQTYEGGAESQLASLLFVMLAVIGLARLRGSADGGPTFTGVRTDRVNL